MLLEYLVPSKARREVWKVLRSLERGVTVRELARKAGVPYSNAYREVLRMREVGLLRTEPVGRALVCEWEPNSPATRKLTELLDLPRKEGVNDPDVYWNLKSWGAGLARHDQSKHRLTVEESLAYGAELARRDPDVAQVWPVVLAKNRGSIDLGRLEVLGKRLGQKRALGFLLSLTGTLMNDSRLLDFSQRFRDSRVRSTQDFFRLTRGKRTQALTEANTPELARRWLFRMNTSIESFQSHFDKFVRRPPKSPVLDRP